MRVSTYTFELSHGSPTDLEFDGKIVHITAILVVILRIAPDEAHFLLKRIPSLEVGDISRRCAAMDSSGALSYAFQRHWMPYEFVVVLESAGW